jgi:hypothetical protein
MGYTSQVLLAVAFETKEQLEEVWAVYCLHPFVQGYDLAKHWTRTDTVHPTLWLSMDNVKWYESYEDVQGFKHLDAVARTFATERDFSYAWLKYRIGEDDADIEVVDSGNHDDLRDYLYDNAGIRREIIHGFS